MVPVRLSLRNFMSYGEDVPPLEFDQFHVACLTGDNGNGKSALLDAMVWALWGEGRKASGDRKADEGLLRIGASEMRVEFEFDLEGDRYCVIREFRKTPKGSRTSLEFLVYDQSKGQYVPLSESSSLTKTQRKINSVLNMDYQTFINSAFILQGRADEFTKKSPGERKEILSEILGLSRYELLSRRARERAQEAESRLQSCNLRISEIDRELSRKDFYLSKVRELEGRISALSSDVESIEGELEVLLRQERELQARREQVGDIDGRISGLESDIRDIEARLEALRTELVGCEELISKGEDIDRSYRRYEELRAEERRLSETLLELRELEQERRLLESKIAEEGHRLESERKVLESELEKAKLTLAELEGIIGRGDEVEDGYNRFLKAKEEEALWQQRQERYEDLRRRELELRMAVEGARSALESELKLCEEELSGLRRKMEAKEGILRELEGRRSELEKLEGLEGERDEIYREGTSMRARAEGIRREMELLRSEIEDEEKRLRVLEESPEARCPLCESRLSEPRLKELNRKINFEIERRTERINALGRELASVEAEMERLRDRYRELSSVTKQLSGLRESVFALEASLGELTSAETRAAELEDRISRIREDIGSGRYAVEEQGRLQKLREEIEATGYDQERHSSSKKLVEELEHFRQEKAELDRARSRRDEVAGEIRALEERLSSVISTVEEGRYSLEERERLSSLTERISSLGYDEASHREIQRELDALKDAPLQVERLRKAKAEISRISGEISALEGSLAGKLEQRGELLSRREELEREISSSVGIEGRIKELKLRLDSAKEQKEAALQEIGKYQGKYENCLELEAERERLESERAEAERRMLIYNELSTAFGKDGIQSLIIESTIPELEDEANYILSKLTDNGTHITIEPLRDLKKGGAKETLDIRISDEMGTRDYELYSGGEAFRTDFAIRIALSKLLARRAGAKLRTLVIDEGFGTQDSRGLQNLIGAIQSISEDFDKIIVVTHLEELRNAFPVRIEVEKSPETGSRYRIVR